MTLKDNFSIVYYNIQSTVNKVCFIESERCNFDIICVTESWLDGRASGDMLHLNGFSLYRRDRSDDNHGDINVYSKYSDYRWL